MMRPMNANRQVRLPTSSQENQKTKKLGLTSSNSKNKNMSSSVASMTSSLKKSSYDPKSGKKTIGIGSSTSNKSLKSVKDISPSPTPLHAYKKNEISNKQNADKKTGTTIPIKNIKQRICGMGLKQDTNKLNTTVLNSTVLNSQNMSKKSNEIVSVHKEKFIEQKEGMPQKHYFYNGSTNKDSKVTIKGREKSGLMDFTAQLNSQQCEELKQPTGELTLDQFELGRKLGKGRFGDVFMAREIRTGFALAIKIINKKELKESEMEKQLIQEIKIQMYSNHPNVLKMYGFFSDNNKIYLLLELATNGCLFKEIRKKSYLQENLASFYFRQVTSGVRYLHSNSVIHRDIKPENILNCFNVLKLCDFGWAIYSPIQYFLILFFSQRQTFCGTLDYVPPEIVTGEFYDEKADVWCLGVLCYELCTGKAPFESTTDENETYDKILKVNIEFPIYLSQQIVDFIGKILTRDPSKRLNLEEVESHQWMRMYQNETGRMISKEIWDKWMDLTKV